MSGPYSTLTTDNYLEAAQALLPRGPAWPRDKNAMFTNYMNAIANVAWLAHSALADLFENELNPAETSDMLADWEEAFGVTPRGSKSARRANLLAVISDPGGFSAAHYVALAASIGITITTAVSAPFTWQVHAPASLHSDARTALEALINSHNRATCVLTFVYDL